MVTNDSRYVSHHVIAANISRKWKSKTFNLTDIMEWCSIAETSFLKEIDKMVHFYQIDLVVDTDNHTALLPCNIFRILDVYSDPNNSESAVSSYNNGSHLILPDTYTGDVIYINYVGQPISDEGEPLIIKGHENVCETYCLMCLFEEDAHLGKFPYQAWKEWDNKMSGQIAATKNDMRHYDRSYFNKLTIIRGNMIQKIGNVGLYHSQFK